MVTVRHSALESMAELAIAVLQDRGDAPFVWCHFPYVEHEGRTTLREFGDGSVLALNTATGQWMVPGSGRSRKPQWTDHLEEGMCRVPLVDVLVPVHRLRAVLEAMRQQGQTQITFEGLRRSSLIALGTDDGDPVAIPAAQGVVSEFTCAAAAAAAARIVYHYVKLDHLWSGTKDRRDRRYYLSSVLETLDWMQGHVVLQDKGQETGVRDGVTPRLRPVAPPAIGSRQRNGGTETFNIDLTCV